MKGKLIICIGIIIILLILSIFVYKKINNGNNISRMTSEELIQYVLNISSYKATLNVEIQSNKNANKYVLEQTFAQGEGMKQKVLEPQSIEGIETTYINGELKVENTKLNLSKVYSNYPYITENVLWLNTFMEEYKQKQESIKETENEVVLKVKSNKSNNKYNFEKELYIDKKTGKPSKMIVKDINQNKIIYIEYNNIELKDIQKEDILAFKM